MATAIVNHPPVRRRKIARRSRLAIGAFLAVAAAIGLWLWHPDLDGAFLSLMEWLDGMGPQAAVWLISLQALMVVLAIPGPFFTMGAGYLFGPLVGSAVAICGSTLGAVAAYWIARAFPEGKTPSWVSRFPRLRILERFVMLGGWKVVLSTRLIPFFPFKLSNYFFGWIRFPFRHFFWGTFLGIAPITMVAVSTGALASDVTALFHPRAGVAEGRWIWSVASLALAAGVLAYVGYRARAELRRVVPEAEEEDEEGEEDE